MKWTIAAIGKPKLPFAAIGIEDYLSRLGKITTVEFLPVKPPKSGSESAALLARTPNAVRIVLDERGRQLTSLELARRVEHYENSAARSVAVLIGGAEGHDGPLRDSADLVLSLSRFTLQHELALVVFLEQLYRAYSILKGFPYHRE